jgi:hypothetical protein
MSPNKKPFNIQQTWSHLSKEMLSGHSQHIEATDRPPQLALHEAELPGLPLTPVLQPLDQLSLSLPGLHVGLGGKPISRCCGSLLWVPYLKKKRAICFDFVVLRQDLVM